MSGFAGFKLDDEPTASGAQGHVYFGTGPSGDPIALKVATATAHAQRALQEEVRILRSLAGTPGVMPVLADGWFRGAPAFAMPRYRDDFAHWLQRCIQDPTSSTLREIFHRTAQVADVLARVHDQHDGDGYLVHRDIKPENLFVDGEQVILADFGGAMAVNSLTAMELAVFGTPMWAPLDQILPAIAMPDPTWDTYALCVILYAAVTGARPAYQSDPRQLLTAKGRKVWQAAEAVVRHTRAGAHGELRAIRTGTHARDLVDPTGRAALLDADRQVLAEGLARLCELAGLSEKRTKVLQRGVWNLLVRGLSPVSHPSPPNRWRQASELAEHLHDFAALCDDADEAPSRSFDIATEEFYVPSRASRRGARPMRWVMLFAGFGALGVAASRIWGVPGFDNEPVAVSATTVRVGDRRVPVEPFRVDPQEVTLKRWRDCVKAGRCEPLDQEPGPVYGVSAEAAVAFCSWAGGRLPSELEWLALHHDAPYPWGTDLPTCDRSIGLGCEADRPLAAAHRGENQEGVEDLAGNVWEWTTTADGFELRGGAINTPVSQIGVDARSAEPKAWSGARCVYAP